MPSKRTRINVLLSAWTTIFPNRSISRRVCRLSGIFLSQKCNCSGRSRDRHIALSMHPDRAIFMSRVALPGGADHDFVDVDMWRQGEQPLYAVGNGPGFEQLAEFGNRFAEVFLVISGHVLEFTDHDAGHDQGDAHAVLTDLAAQRFGKSTDGEFAGTVETAERGDIPSYHGSDDHDVAAFPLEQVLPRPLHQVGGPKNV